MLKEKKKNVELYLVSTNDLREKNVESCFFFFFPIYTFFLLFSHGHGFYSFQDKLHFLYSFFFFFLISTQAQQNQSDFWYSEKGWEIGLFNIIRVRFNSLNII